MAKMQKKRSFSADIWRRFTKNKPAVFGMCLFIIIMMVALCANLIVPAEKAIEVTPNRLLPPSVEHWFGTDNVGRDLFARVIHGSRYSLSIGLVSTGIAVIIGSFIGAACGYYGSLFDSVVMRLLDIINSMPALLLLMAIVAAMGAGTVNFFIAMTIALTPGFIRLVRSTVMSITDIEYIQAAKAYGSSSFHIIVKHVMPNAMGLIIVDTANSISGAILAAAGLSYLGFGVQPPTPEWGVILSSMEKYMRVVPTGMLFPGLAIMLSALSINLVGDGLRDALDPKLKD